MEQHKRPGDEQDSIYSPPKPVAYVPRSRHLTVAPAMLGFRGRLNRARYLVSLLWFFFIVQTSYLIYQVNIYFYVKQHALTGIGKPVYGAVYTMQLNSNLTLAIIVGMFWVTGFLVAAYLFFSCSIRRWHDMGKSGWYMLMIVIPILTLPMIGWICFAPGDQRFNNFGYPNPANGFALYRTMLGVFILLLASHLTVVYIAQVLLQHE